MLISVITTVYNGEKYLSTCLESVLKQSIADWEMILVDDGSTDQSGAFCDAFAKRDQRIHVIHQENQGLPAARNVGIQNAKGDYLVFLDIDDWISPDMFYEIAMASKKRRPDILIINLKKVVKAGKYEISDWFIPLKTTSERIHLLLVCGYLRESWRKCCKRELFNNIQFPKELRSTQDLYNTADLAVLAHSFGVVDYAWYFYNKMNQDSITHKGAAVRRSINNFKAWKHFYDLGKIYYLDEKASVLFDRYKNKMTEFALLSLQLGIPEENKEAEQKMMDFLQEEKIPFTDKKDQVQQKTLAACRALRDSCEILGTLSPVWAKRGIKELIKLFAIEAAVPFLKTERERMLSLLVSLYTPEVKSSLTLGQKMAVWSIKN